MANSSEPKRLFERPLIWRDHRRSISPAIALLCVQGGCGACTISMTSSLPAWDLGALAGTLGYAWLALTVLTFGYGVYLFRGAARGSRVAGVVGCLAALLLGPWSHAGIEYLMRAGGEVTLENWKEHRALHEAASFAEEFDRHPKRFQSKTRSGGCPGKPRFQQLDIDGTGKVRRYVEGTRQFAFDSLARYYDEAGVLRFVWQHGYEHRTFLDAQGRVLWAWESSSYGLQAVKPEFLQPASAFAAQREFERDEPACPSH